MAIAQLIVDDRGDTKAVIATKKDGGGDIWVDDVAHVFAQTTAAPPDLSVGKLLFLSVCQPRRTVWVTDDPPPNLFQGTLPVSIGACVLLLPILVVLHSDDGALVDLDADTMGRMLVSLGRLGWNRAAYCAALLGMDDYGRAHRGAVVPDIVPHSTPDMTRSRGVVADATHDTDDYDYVDADSAGFESDGSEMGLEADLADMATSDCASDEGSEVAEDEVDEDVVETDPATADTDGEDD